MLTNFNNIWKECSWVNLLQMLCSFHYTVKHKCMNIMHNKTAKFMRNYDVSRDAVENDATQRKMQILAN